MAETQISSAQVSEPVTKDAYNNSERHIPQPPQPETLLPMQTFPVPVATITVVPGAGPGATAIPVVPQPIPPIPQAVDASYYTNTAYVTTPQVQQQPPQQPPQPQAQAPAPAPRINDVIGPAPNIFFLQESELDTPEVVASQAPVVSHIPTVATTVVTAVSHNAPIPTQTYTNQSFANPHVVPTQVN